MSVKQLIITVLTTLLIGCGLVATCGDYLKSLFIHATSFYSCTINLKNGLRTNLPGIWVKLNGDSAKSDDYGTVIFNKVRSNAYKCSFTFANKPHVENFILKHDTNITFDIARSLTNPITGIAVKSNLNQPNKSNNQRTATILPTAIKIMAVQQNPALLKNTAVVDTPTRPAPARSLTANEILQTLQLKVRVDNNDSYKGRGQQFAYHYYLAGSASYLGQIIEVLYQRNDPTFPEFQNHQFNISDERENGFEYVGYQWGSVSTTYVQIVLSNGSKSDIFLKGILYDK